MDLMFGLATVDKMQGDKGARRLYRGWTGRESAMGRKVRRAVAATLLALAARLDSVDGRAVPAGTPAVGAGRP